MGSAPYNVATIDRREIARRIKKLFPEAFIIVLIRNQIDILPSFHAQLRFLKKEKTSLCTFLDQNLKCSIGNSYLSYFNYYEILSYYDRIFGPGKIKVFMYEDFKYKPDMFINELSRFLNINTAESKLLIQNKSENVTSKRRKLPKVQLSNVIDVLENEGAFSLFFKVLNSCKQVYNSYRLAINDQKESIDKDIRSRLLDYYSESNSLLARKFNLPLEQYKYPL